MTKFYIENFIVALDPFHHHQQILLTLDEKPVYLFLVEVKGLLFVGYFVDLLGLVLNFVPVVKWTL